MLWSNTSTLSDLEELLFDAGVPMLHQWGERGHLVFVASRARDDAFASPSLAVHAFCGASRLIQNLARVPDGVREARKGVPGQSGARLAPWRRAPRPPRWALEVVGEQPGQRVVYGDRAARFFPRSATDAEEVVAQVLGPAREYDAAHGSDLVRTLEVLFETNRSWQEAAKRLGIQRQTLVYRIRRIEQVTQYDTNSFQGPSQAVLRDTGVAHVAIRLRTLTPACVRQLSYRASRL